MSPKSLSTLLSLICTIVVVMWILDYSRTTETPKVINKVRSYSVLNLTWARVENWRKDANASPCKWRSTRTLPFIGSFTVDCMVEGASWMRFSVSADMETVKPADDERTRHRLDELSEWARLRKRYP